jgi:hypothetical protein
MEPVSSLCELERSQSIAGMHPSLCVYSRHSIVFSIALLAR